MQTDLDVILELGSILVIETGCYSDKQWEGPVRLVRRVSKRELAEAFKLAWRDPATRVGRYGYDWDEDEGPRPDCFLPWLVRAGYVEHIDCHSWDVGNYGEFEP